MAELSEESPASPQLPSLEIWALRIIEVVAPEELPAFQTLAEPYIMARSVGRLRRMRGPDTLGSGLDAAAAFTTIALLMCDVAKGVLVDTTKEAISRRATRVFRSRWPEDAAVPLSLTAEGLASARSRALKAAIDADVEPEKARAIADAMVGALLDIKE
jgi:hypothetical protein